MASVGAVNWCCDLAMISLPIWFWIAAAVLLFWAVGAYNRLVRLRAAIKQSFASVEAHIRQRDALLAQWLGACSGALGGSAGSTDGIAADNTEAHTVNAARGACVQVMAAVDHARAAPSGAQAIASLRLAEEVLIGARGRLSTELAAHSRANLAWDTVMQTDELAAVDGTLGFARSQFNEAVQAYNDAAMQFPTWVIAGVFGFRSAGVL
jgi:LemA protein